MLRTGLVLVVVLTSGGLLACGQTREPPGTSATGGSEAEAGSPTDSGGASAMGGVSAEGGVNATGGSVAVGGNGGTPAACEDPGYDGLPERSLAVVDAAPDAPMLQPSGGTRIQVRFLLDDDEFEAPHDLFDTQLDTPCRISYGADGELRCIPVADAPPADFIPTCPNPNGQPADDAFVRFVPKRVKVGKRIEVPVLEGEDGSRVIAFPDVTHRLEADSLPPLLGLQDLELGSLVDWAPGDTRLLPRALVPASTHPLVLSECQPSVAICGDALPFFPYPHGACDPDVLTHVRLDQRQLFAVTPSDSDTYGCFCTEGGCYEPTNVPSSQSGFRATERVPFESWAPVEVVKLAQGVLASPPRLAIESVVLRELAEPIVYGGSERCVPQIAADGQLRCVGGEASRYFLDADCKQPAVYDGDYTAGMRIKNSDAPFDIDETPVHVFEVDGEKTQVDDLFFGGAGPCQPLVKNPQPFVVYLPGAEVDPKTFTALHLEAR